MDVMVDQYYKLNKVLLLCLGLWPYDTSLVKTIQIIFYQALFASILLCQVNVFFVRNCNVVLVMKILIFVTGNFIVIVKYNAWLLVTNKIKSIFDRIHYDWNMLKNQTELKIIQKYANNTRFYTVSFMLIVNLLSLGELMLCSMPFILDAIMPINGSRPLWIPIAVEYFVDQEKYYLVIVTHILLYFWSATMVMIAVATMIIAYVLHNCALFKITSYRIEHILDGEVLSMSKDNMQYLLFDRIVHAIHLHRRAVDFATDLTDSFATLYFVLLGLGVFCVTFSVVHFFHLLASLDDVIELLLAVSVIFLNLYYIFVGNYIGQSVIDDSTNIFQATQVLNTRIHSPCTQSHLQHLYSMEWYATPLWLQKIILFMMGRSKIKSTLTAGGLFDASLEGFATLISMSMSYIMFLRSARD